ncbi:hypothetical protein GE061_019811 [Apolygus lucorum]|uniref:Retrotransposon gag domain-containing protein n=1 Tax=Apolygus lucorum TaxID=248454 RepID=A0A8S9XBI7_APOLU|nr:hypothetical protein GE061_019811 [Apolygus lucorum]
MIFGGLIRCRRLNYFEKPNSCFKARRWKFWKLEVNNWNDLEHRLTLAFTDPTYEKRLKREILDRKQGDDEPIIVYFSKLDNLFNLLTRPMSDEDKLEIIEENILPEYQMALSLHSYRNLQQLENLLVKLEKSRAKAKSSLSQFTKSVEPSLQHQSRNSQKPRMDKGVTTRADGRVSTLKCDEKPVSSQDSTDKQDKKSVYCYSCKKPGVTRRNCPKCTFSRSENEKSGINVPGVVLEPKSTSQSRKTTN